MESNNMFMKPASMGKTQLGQDVDLDGLMSDRKALKIVVKSMFPTLNHQQRRAKVSEFHKILHKRRRNDWN